MSRKAAVEPKWNFYLDTNKSTGIQYVQTSYNIWVPAQRLKYSGCMALRTNEVPNPFRALELYRQRNAVECSYRVFKNQIEGDRMLATQTSYRGKLFVFTLATCLRTMMRVKAEAQAKGFDLKIPGSSLSQVFEFQRGVTLQHRAPLTAGESTC